MPANTHLDDTVVHRIGPLKPSPDDRSSAAMDAWLAILRRVARRGGKVIVVAALAGGVLGFAVASRPAPVYDGVATLLVTRPAGMPDSNRPPNVSTFRALLETNTLATAAIAQFHLDQPPYHIAAGDFMTDVLNLEEVRNTNLIRVHARLRNPNVAADLADYIATTAIALNEGINRQQTADLRGQLQTMLDEATSRMKEAERQLLDFRKAAQIDVTRKDADAALDQRGQLLALTVDIESEKARLARAEQDIQSQNPYLAAPRQVDAEAALRTVDPRALDESKTPRPSSRNPPDPAADKRAAEAARRASDAEKQADADKQGLDLSNAFANPVYQVLQYQISLSRTRLASLEARRRQLVGVEGLGGRELPSLGALYPKEIQLRRLETEYELTKTGYSEVVLEYERARLRSAGITSKLQLIDRAVPPTRPQSRHRILIALFGLLGAATVTAVAVAAVEFGRRR
jgi:uncharacterized protein involved in exopolysaccharide biosynthesis